MTLSDKDLVLLGEVALKAAQEAGTYIQSHFDKQVDPQYKQGGDTLASQIVTVVDTNAQKIILTHLQESIQKFDLGLLTEESVDDQSRLFKDYFWCIDPMDGTLAFTEGRSGYAVSISLVSHSGDPVIGVVYVPDFEHAYTAIRRRGVQLNNVDFKRSKTNDQLIHVFLDRSTLNQSYFDLVMSKMEEYAGEIAGRQIQPHSNYGAVRNALEVMNSRCGCYFKFPKSSNGGGSIWDFAATRLFFEELNLNVSDTSGEPLHLNDPNSTFMNKRGIVYSTHLELFEFIIQLGKLI